MPFPTILSVTPLQLSTIASSQTVTLPTTSSGQLLVVSTFNNSNMTASTVSGWTKTPATDLDRSSWLRGRTYVRECDGSESGGSLVIPTSGSTNQVGVMIHVQAGTWTAWNQSPGATSAGLPHDPDEVTASISGDHIYFVISAVTGTPSAWTPPSGYTLAGDADGLWEVTNANDAFRDAMGVAYLEETSASEDPPTMTFNDDDHTGSFTFVIEGTGSTYDQEGFRFRNDDGDEDAATWRQNQDVDDTVGYDPFRLRILTDTAEGDPTSEALRLQYKRSDESEWRDV